MKHLYFLLKFLQRRQRKTNRVTPDQTEIELLFFLPTNILFSFSYSSLLCLSLSLPPHKHLLNPGYKSGIVFKHLPYIVSYSFMSLYLSDSVIQRNVKGPLQKLSSVSYLSLTLLLQTFLEYRGMSARYLKFLLTFFSFQLQIYELHINY